MSKYLVIGYKENSDDYARGCHVESYSSDFYSTVCESTAELVDEYVRLSTWHLGCNEEGFEIEILNTNFDEVSLEALGISVDVEKRTAEVYEGRKLELEKQRVKDRNRAEENKRKRELAQLEELKEKYEGTARIGSPYYREDATL
jgi:hypothetical protein